MENTEKLLDLGRLVITPAALEALGRDSAVDLATRFARRDFGTMSNEGEALNQAALKDGSRLIGVYTDLPKTVWVIREALGTDGQTATTILLPNDY